MEHEFDKSIGLAYFYLNSQDFQASGLPTILRSILRQLSAPLHGLPISVQEIWDTFGREGRAPTIDVLKYALTAVMRDFREVRICFDGVDQLPWESVLQLAELIRGFGNQNNVYLLMTSRPFRFDEFRYLVHAKVDFEAQQSDLESYVNWRLSRSVRLQSFPLLRETVLLKVLNSAGGMQVFTLREVSDCLLMEIQVPCGRATDGLGTKTTKPKEIAGCARNYPTSSLQYLRRHPEQNSPRRFSSYGSQIAHRRVSTA